MKSRNLFQIYRNSHLKNRELWSVKTIHNPCNYGNHDSRVTKGLRTWHCRDSGIQPALTTLPGLMEIWAFQWDFRIDISKNARRFMIFMGIFKMQLRQDSAQFSSWALRLFRKRSRYSWKWFPEKNRCRVQSHDEGAVGLCNLSGMNGMNIKKEKRFVKVQNPKLLLIDFYLRVGVWRRNTLWKFLVSAPRAALCARRSVHFARGAGRVTLSDVDLMMLRHVKKSPGKSVTTA